MPLGIDQGVGAIVWSPLGWGRLTGKIRRGQPLPAGSRLHDTAGFAPPVEDERSTAWSTRWTRRRGDRQDPAADRAQLAAAAADRVQRAHRRARRGATEAEPRRGRLALTPEQIARLDAASAVTPPYPYYPYTARRASPA